MKHFNTVNGILSCGRSLEEVGVENWALSKKQALDALIKLEAHKIVVLGGDVYKIVNEIPQMTYDNWCCDPKKNESSENYLLRSLEESEKYISNYSFTGDGSKILFAIVCKNS